MHYLKILIFSLSGFSVTFFPTYNFFVFLIVINPNFKSRLLMFKSRLVIAYHTVRSSILLLLCNILGFLHNFFEAISCCYDSQQLIIVVYNILYGPSNLSYSSSFSSDISDDANTIKRTFRFLNRIKLIQDISKRCFWP